MTRSGMVAETWRHSRVDRSRSDYRVLVRYATLAASSHNTQPWIFKLESNRIQVRPDRFRRCPAVDPDDHHLYASFGCATENLLLAAQAAGLKGHCRFDPSTTGLQVTLEEAQAVRSALLDAIPLRQCSRSEYDGAPLTKTQLEVLEGAAHGEGVSVLMMTGTEQKKLVTEYVAAGNEAQFADPAWAQELKSWIRFNGKEAVRSGDGLYGPAMGNPGVPRWLGLLAMKGTFSAKNQNRKDRRHIQSSSAIAVICSEADDIPRWIEAGRSYQRLALQAAS